MIERGENRNAETQKRRNAETQKRRNAETQKRRNAETQKRRNAETQKRRNAETRRAQSYWRHTSSALSASPRFKTCDILFLTKTKRSESEEPRSSATGRAKFCSSTPAS